MPTPKASIHTSRNLSTDSATPTNFQLGYPLLEKLTTKRFDHQTVNIDEAKHITGCSLITYKSDNRGSRHTTSSTIPTYSSYLSVSTHSSHEVPHTNQRQSATMQMRPESNIWDLLHIGTNEWLQGGPNETRMPSPNWVQHTPTFHQGGGGRRVRGPTQC